MRHRTTVGSPHTRGDRHLPRVKLPRRSAKPLPASPARTGMAPNHPRSHPLERDGLAGPSPHACSRQAPEPHGPNSHSRARHRPLPVQAASPSPTDHARGMDRRWSIPETQHGPAPVRSGKWLPGEDSNLERQDQNLLCCQLHHRVAVHSPRKSSGGLALPYSPRQRNGPALVRSGKQTGAGPFRKHR